MILEERSIPGLFVLESPVHGDERGFFREWFQFFDFEAADETFSVEQANLSFSARDVVRALHYSLAPRGQAKVVTCAQGELDDVVVDVRVGSPTYGAHEVITLRAGDGKSILVPAGVAHGFVVTSETGTIVYLLSSPYEPGLELEIDAFDPEIGVPWRLTSEPVRSAKDAAAPLLAERRAAGELPLYLA